MQVSNSFALIRSAGGGSSAWWILWQVRQLNPRPSWGLPCQCDRSPFSWQVRQIADGSAAADASPAADAAAAASASAAAAPSLFLARPTCLALDTAVKERIFDVSPPPSMWAAPGPWHVSHSAPPSQSVRFVRPCAVRPSAVAISSWHVAQAPASAYPAPGAVAAAAPDVGLAAAAAVPGESCVVVTFCGGTSCVAAAPAAAARTRTTAEASSLPRLTFMPRALPGSGLRCSHRECGAEPSTEQ